MERQLKHHEKKLLKKVNFLDYKRESTARENTILRRYMVLKREDYTFYNKLAGAIQKLAHQLAKLNAKDPFREKMADQLLDKLYNMGVIPLKKSLAQAAKVTPSAFCRRRLPIILCRMKFCENLKEATTFVQQGHIRVGTDVITDPAFLVTRQMEDFVQWTDTSKIRKKVLAYNDKLDDFDFLEDRA